MTPEMMTPKEYFTRAAARKKRRRQAREFNAKIKGIEFIQTKTIIKKQLDDLTSLLVRRRDRSVYYGLCLVCKAKERLGLLNRPPEPIQCAYHVLPRGDGLVHWDLRNIVGACTRCNQAELWSRYKFSLRDQYRKIHIEIIGEAILLELEGLARQVAHYTLADLIAMRDERKAMLEGKP